MAFLVKRTLLTLIVDPAWLTDERRAALDDYAKDIHLIYSGPHALIYRTPSLAIRKGINDDWSFADLAEKTAKAQWDLSEELSHSP